MGTGRVSSGDADVHRHIARFRNICTTMSTNTNGYIKLMSNRKKTRKEGPPNRPSATSQTLRGVAELVYFEVALANKLV
jgi:hypothetical protein